MTELDLKQKIIENLKEIISELEETDYEAIETSFEENFLNDLDEKVSNLKWWEH